MSCGLMVFPCGKMVMGVSLYNPRSSSSPIVIPTDRAPSAPGGLEDRLCLVIKDWIIPIGHIVLYSMLKEVVTSTTLKFSLGNHKQFDALLQKAEHSVLFKLNGSL